MPSDFQVPTLRRHHIPAMPRPTRVPGRSLSHPDVSLPLQQHPLAFLVLAFYYHTIDARGKVHATGYRTWPSWPHRCEPPSCPSVVPAKCDRSRLSAYVGRHIQGAQPTLPPDGVGNEDTPSLRWIVALEPFVILCIAHRVSDLPKFSDIFNHISRITNLDTSKPVTAFLPPPSFC